MAGAFGSHVDVKYAMILGMIPDCDLKNVTSAGNAAGTGARIALLDRNSRSEIRQVVRNIEKVETAVEPSFQTYFVEAMAIPHKNAKYRHLTKVVELPQSTDTSTEGQGQRRRRRRSASRAGQMKTDLIITGGRVIDGTGEVSKVADVVVDKGRITGVGGLFRS